MQCSVLFTFELESTWLYVENKAMKTLLNKIQWQYYVKTKCHLLIMTDSVRFNTLSLLFVNSNRLSAFFFHSTLPKLCVSTEIVQLSENRSMQFFSFTTDTPISAIIYYYIGATNNSNNNMPICWICRI